jgi:hypothetical protein
MHRGRCWSQNCKQNIGGRPVLIRTTIGIISCVITHAPARSKGYAEGATSLPKGMRIDEVIAHYAAYRAAHPTHAKLSRRAFIDQLQLSPSAEAWLTLKSVEYRPFAGADPTNQLAIVVYPSPGSGSGDRVVFFRIGDLIAP